MCAGYVPEGRCLEGGWGGGETLVRRHCHCRQLIVVTQCNTILLWFLSLSLSLALSFFPPHFLSLSAFYSDDDYFFADWWTFIVRRCTSYTRRRIFTHKIDDSNASQRDRSETSGRIATSVFHNICILNTLPSPYPYFWSRCLRESIEFQKSMKTARGRPPFKCRSRRNAVVRPKHIIYYNRFK